MWVWVSWKMVHRACLPMVGIYGSWRKWAYWMFLFSTPDDRSVWFTWWPPSCFVLRCGWYRCLLADSLWCPSCLSRREFRCSCRHLPAKRFQDECVHCRHWFLESPTVCCFCCREFICGSFSCDRRACSTPFAIPFRWWWGRTLCSCNLLFHCSTCLERRCACVLCRGWWLQPLPCVCLQIP